MSNNTKPVVMILDDDIEKLRELAGGLQDQYQIVERVISTYTDFTRVLAEIKAKSVEIDGSPVDLDAVLSDIQMPVTLPADAPIDHRLSNALLGYFSLREAQEAGLPHAAHTSNSMTSFLSGGEMINVIAELEGKPRLAFEDIGLIGKGDIEAARTWLQTALTA